MLTKIPNNKNNHFVNHDLKPPLKWAGGKRWLLPHLLPILQKFENKRLVEPFCGGLAVALGLKPKQALLNDINALVINFYKCLQFGLQTNLLMANNETLYYQYRLRLNDLIASGNSDGSESAELFYYLNRSGYNGLSRFNSKGQFNVPFGRYKTINYLQDFSGYKEVFKNWQFLACDFEQLIIRSDDIVYADPPYDVQFTKYAKEDFTWHDQERLANWLGKLNVPVVVSNQATSRIIKLYKKLGFRINKLSAPRMISCNGNRAEALEILAFKNIS